MRLSRRALFAALGGLAVMRREASGAQAQAGRRRFRLAICNETFQGWDFARSCRGALETGYTGVEIAPYTLSEDPASLPPGRRKEFRRTMAATGVEYVGLHSLLTAPRGRLHITTPDAAVRKRSWEYFHKLIDLAADLGEGAVMVLGSSKQRGTVGGSSVEDALKRLRDGLAAAAPHAEQRGVTILAEPLAPHLCDVLNTVAEAVELVEEIGSPAVQTMFDTHNAAAEKLPHDEVIRRYAPYIRHVHLNEMDGRAPGMGTYDFARVLRALRQIGYSRWLSVEVFHFEPSGEAVARSAARYLRRVEEGLDGEQSATDASRRRRDSEEFRPFRLRGGQA